MNDNKYIIMRVKEYIFRYEESTYNPELYSLLNEIIKILSKKNTNHDNK